MGPERHRRLVVLILMCVLLLVTSWLEHHFQHLTTTTTTTTTAPATLTPPPSTATAKNSGKRKIQLKVELGGGGSQGRKADPGDYTDDYVDELDEDDDDEDFAYFKALRAKSRLLTRASTLHLDLHSCLPRFICELHALAPGTSLTDFEKDVLGLFRNHVVLEGPDSPVYPYQVAAHMGQLCTGLDPSPCHSLYPACPLSRTLLLEVLRSVKSSRRMFHSG